jgi:hypothetical protein
LVAPTPMIVEVTTCVVDTGAPKCAAVKSTTDDVVSAA